MSGSLVFDDPDELLVSVHSRIHGASAALARELRLRLVARSDAHALAMEAVSLMSLGSLGEAVLLAAPPPSDAGWTPGPELNSLVYSCGPVGFGVCSVYVRTASTNRSRTAQ